MVVTALSQIRLACSSPRELPTVWPNKIDLFRADSLARHLLQLAYDLSIRAVDKTYLIKLVSDMPPKRRKVPQQRPQAETLGEIKLDSEVLK
jgi:hypothetical protein